MAWTENLEAAISRHLHSEPTASLTCWRTVDRSRVESYVQKTPKRLGNTKADRFL